MKRYRRKRKEKKHPILGLVANKTILMSKENHHLLWIWTGKCLNEEDLKSLPLLTTIGHSAASSKRIKERVREKIVLQSRLDDWNRSGTDEFTIKDARVVPATIERINNMTFIHPDYIQIVSKYKTNLERQRKRK